MRALIIVLGLGLATPALAAPQHEAHTSVTSVTAGHASTTRASSHGKTTGTDAVEKEAAGLQAGTHAQAARATGTTVKVVPVPRPPRPSGNSRELAAALARISQRLSAMSVGTAGSGHGRGDTPAVEPHITLVWRTAIDWPTELTGDGVALALDSSACVAPSLD